MIISANFESIFYLKFFLVHAINSSVVQPTNCSVVSLLNPVVLPVIVKFSCSGNGTSGGVTVIKEKLILDAASALSDSE